MAEIQESSPLAPSQQVRAVQAFVGEEQGDLPFGSGEVLTIVKKSDLLYWYVARNRNGQEGLVPRNFLQVVSDSTPVVPPKPSKGVGPPGIPPKPGKPVIEDDTMFSGTDQLEPQVIEEARMIQLIQAREKEQRLKAGTLVVGRAPYESKESGDLSFGINEELQILRPLPDLGWYYAKKLDKSGKSGAIPITHVRLVYDSDDEEEKVYDQPRRAGHDKMYDDMSEFISESGWFTFSGYALGREALLHRLAQKCFMEFDEFMSTKDAIYILTFGEDEKVFVGKADVLHEELAKHFTCFGKKREEIREIDDELCHHSQECQWSLKTFPIKPPSNLEVEWAKKVMTCNSLMSAEDSRGLNEVMTLTSWDNWEEFRSWFFPS